MYGAKIEVLIFTIEIIALLPPSGIRECHVSPDDLVAGLPLGCRIVQGLGREIILKRRGTEDLAIWHLVVRLQVVYVRLFNLKYWRFTLRVSVRLFAAAVVLAASTIQRVPIRLPMTSTVLLGCQLPSRTRVPI
jgi:hypothetical protein